MAHAQDVYLTRELYCKEQKTLNLEGRCSGMYCEHTTVLNMIGVQIQIVSSIKSVLGKVRNNIHKVQYKL